MPSMFQPVNIPQIKKVQQTNLSKDEPDEHDLSVSLRSRSVEPLAEEYM